MSNNTPTPLEFIKNMWSSMGFNLPGMVTPTFDIEELDKRISDLKTVEGWLSMNLSMLHMSIQGLEMQRATLAVVQTMGQQMTEQTTAGPAATDPAKTATADPAMPWPWNLMQQMQTMQQTAPASPPSPEETPEEPPTSKSRKQPKQQ